MKRNNIRRFFSGNVKHGMLLIIIACAIILVLGLIGIYAHQEPVRIGYSAQCTGSTDDLGIRIRNGVQLAVEEINAAGGIQGRPIELVIRDDHGTPEGARTADQELVDAGVVAIIGHITSRQTLAGLQITDPARIIMISPSSATPDLTGKDDYFFRLSVPLDTRSRDFAQHIQKDYNLTSIALLYDTDNVGFSDQYARIFSEEFTSLGGIVTGSVGFSSSNKPDFSPLVAGLQAKNPGSLLIIANGFDTSLIVQRINQEGWNIPIFSSEWGLSLPTESSLSFSGSYKGTQGVLFEQTNSLNTSSQAFIDFSTRYEARFGEKIPVGPLLGYEIVYVLSEGLQNTGGRAEGLKEAMLSIQNFPDLIDPVSFDAFGDIIHPAYHDSLQNTTFGSRVT